MSACEHKEFVSYSANLEDVLINRLFPGPKPGFYVDVGAAHPEFESDTKALRDRGWRGINVEPNAEFLKELKLQRPDDINLDVALSDMPGELVFYEVPGTGLSTLERTNAEQAAAKGRAVVKRCIKVSTLVQVLEEAHAPLEFGLLKVDVEGAERAVLAGNDWSRFRPRVVVAEATVPETPVRRDDGICELMQSNGWRRVWFDGLNDWYVAPDFEPPAGTFDSPPNVFDRYVTRRTAAAEAEAAWLRDTVADRDVAAQHLEADAARLRDIVADHDRAMQHHEAEATRLRRVAADRDQATINFEADAARLHQKAEARAIGLRILTEKLAEMLATGAGRLPTAGLAAQLCDIAPGRGGTMADEACMSAARRLLEADNLRLRMALTDLEGELTRDRRAVAELQEALINSRKELAAVHVTAGTARHELATQQILLEDTRHELATQQILLESVQKEMISNRVLMENVQRKVAALLASTSWRISTPVRAVGRLFGRGRPFDRA